MPHQRRIRGTASNMCIALSASVPQGRFDTAIPNTTPQSKRIKSIMVSAKPGTLRFWRNFLNDHIRLETRLHISPALCDPQKRDGTSDSLSLIAADNNCMNKSRSSQTGSPPLATLQRGKPHRHAWFASFPKDTTIDSVTTLRCSENCQCNDGFVSECFWSYTSLEILHIKKYSLHVVSSANTTFKLRKSTATERTRSPSPLDGLIDAFVLRFAICNSLLSDGSKTKHAFSR